MEEMKKEENFFVNAVRRQAFKRALFKFRKEGNLTRRDVIQQLNIEGGKDEDKDSGLERKLNRWEKGESFPTFEKISKMMKESQKFANVYNAEIQKVSEELYDFYRNIFQSDEKTVDFFDGITLSDYLPEATDELYYENKKMLMELKDSYTAQLNVNNLLKKED